MTDRLNLFLQYAEETEVHFVEYIKTRSIDGKTRIIMILEGKDDPKFYTPKFDAIIRKEWTSISVGGKSKALKLREKIRNHPKYHQDLVYFFVDRDYDNNTPFQDTYITPTYSIENLYCSPETVKRLIEAECGLTKIEIINRSEILEFLLAEYINIRNKFHRNKKTILLNSVFCYVRTRKQNSKISLDKILNIETSLTDNKLSVKLKKGALYTDSINSERDEFKKFIKTDTSWLKVANNPAERFRGKQEILILRMYINSLKNDGSLAKKTYAKFGIKVKTENPSMADHILSTASQYVRTPNCLAHFLGCV